VQVRGDGDVNEALRSACTTDDQLAVSLCLHRRHRLYTHTHTHTHCCCCWWWWWYRPIHQQKHACVLGYTFSL